MQGVVFHGERELEIMNFPDPNPGPGEVVVEMKASGMCGSDLHQYRRPKAGRGQNATGLPPNPNPTIAGHEPCGIVAAVGPDVLPAEAKVGQRVMVHHYQGCTQCDHCRSGWQQLCQQVPVKVYGSNSHGGHAKYLLVPANTLVPLADELTFSAGAAISCGSGTAYGALRRMNISGRDTIAIMGQGPVGLAATQFAKAMGARVIALDINPQRLARAKDFGADEVVDPGSNDPVAAIKDLTHGRYADLTLDTSSNAEARLNAIKSTKVWGTMCFVGEGGDVKIDVSPHLLRRQLTLVASWTFSNIIQAECARFCIERNVDVDRLFTHRWNLDQADEAYKQFDKQSDGKGVFLDVNALGLYTELGARGLIVGSSGNVSERSDRGMVITPSGGSPDGVSDSEMVELSLDGTTLNDATPSSEWEMHAGIYRAYPEAACVVHTHADACTALAGLNQELPPFHYMVVQFGGANVRCAPYVTFGTPALAAHAVKALKGRSACLLANHGMILYARDPAQALSRALLLETLCRQYLVALSAGKPRLLSARQISEAKERFKTYGPRRSET